MYFNKKRISYCIKFETNIFIEMIICVAASCKSKSRISFYKFSRDQNLKHSWLIKIKRRYIRSMQHARMCDAYCFGWNPAWKRMRYQLTLNKTFCSISPQRKDINKTMLSGFPWLVFHTKFTMRVKKQINIPS